MRTTNSWTRDNVVANNFPANSGTELNPTSALYDLEFSNYDPVVGRMNQSIRWLMHWHRQHLITSLLTILWGIQMPGKWKEG